MGTAQTTKPKILIAATRRWFTTARLAIALANAGFAVEGLCPPDHALHKTKAVDRTHDYEALMPLRSLAKAIAASKPDLIVPGDDLATHHLHDVHQRSAGREQWIRTLIERSLGAPESFRILRERASLMKLADNEGVRVPQTEVIADLDDLWRWVAQVGFPIVLKANDSSGGDGVRFAYTFEEARRALRKLQAPALMARALKRALLDQDRTLLLPSFLRRKSVVNAQEFIAGYEATSTIACWNGAVLASLQFEVLKKVNSTGHATVLRRIEHPEMTLAAEKVAQGLKLSGIHGLDFMLAADTRDAYLVEINPRTTQIGHLAFGPGRDLSSALFAAITGDSVALSTTQRETIALFPQEWIRDPKSSYLQSAFHDVPWEDPSLVQHCIREGMKQSSWYAQPTPTFPSLKPANRVSAAETSPRPSWIVKESESQYD